MAEAWWAGNDRGSGYTDSEISSNPVNLPRGRLNQNGQHLAMITALYMYAAGRNGPVRAYATLGNASCNWAAPHSSGATGSGWVRTNDWLVDGGTAQIRMDADGQYYFGRSLSGSGVTGEFSSGFIAGGYQFIQGPSVPTSLSATPSTSEVGAVTINWGMVADNGGAGVSGYHVVRDGQYVGAAGGNSFKTVGLTPGQTYSFQVAARNRVTDAAGTSGEYCQPVWVTAPGPPSPPTLYTKPSPITAGTVILEWTTPTKTNGTIEGYGIYRGNEFLGYPAQGTGTTWSDTGRPVNETTTYRITARNRFSSVSDISSLYSNGSTVTVPGLPGAVGAPNAVASTDTYGRITVSWPALTGVYGGVSRYNVYRNGALVSSPTETTFVDDGLTTNTLYSYTIRARNRWGDLLNQVGPASPSDAAIAPGAPSAPQNLAGVSSMVTAGLITLTWDAPLTNFGAITGYNVYYSTGALVATLNGAGRTYAATGLAPGTEYRYYVRARNAISDVVGTPGTPSSTLFITALGEPTAPVGLALSVSPTVAGRLILTWDPVFGSTGYNVYWGGTDTFIAGVQTTSFLIDALTPGVLYSFQVRSRNSVTDATYTMGGPLSAIISRAAGATTSQAVNSLTVANQTNTQLSGTYTVSPLSSVSELKYQRTTPDLKKTLVPSATADITNNTNTELNGTYTIGVPTPTTMTYAKGGAAIAEGTIVPKGSLLDNTNVIFNGVYVVTASDSYSKTVSYTKINSNISGRAATGTITNTSNTVFNVDGATILEITDNTVTYAVTHADLPLSGVSGTMTDVSNRDLFNGLYTVLGTPTHNTFTYTTPMSGGPVVSGDILEPYGDAERADSAAVLRVLYRSGWLG